MLVVYLPKGQNLDPTVRENWRVYQCPSGGFIFDMNKGNWRCRYLVLYNAADQAKLVEGQDWEIKAHWVWNQSIGTHQQLAGPSL